jgi:hypothetical protein
MALNPEQNMIEQLVDGARLLGDLTGQAQAWYKDPRPGDVRGLRGKFTDTNALYTEVMGVLNATHTRQQKSLEIIGRIRDALTRAPAGSNRAHQLETLLQYLISSMQDQNNQSVGRALDEIGTNLSRGGAGETKYRGGGGGREGGGGGGDVRSVGSRSRSRRRRRARVHTRNVGGRKSKTRKAAKRGKKRKGGYKFTRAANSRRSLRMKTRKLKSLTQKSPKKKQKKKHGKKHGKKHDKKSKSRKARKGKHHKRGKRR